MVAVPDASTFQVLPWRPDTKGVARMFCDILTPDGEPFAADPRQVLRRKLHRAADLGLHVLRPPRDGVLPVRGADDRRRWTTARTST